MKVFYSEECLKHEQHPGHPERRERLERTLEVFREYDFIEICNPREYGEDAFKIHDEVYLRFLEKHQGYLTPDTMVYKNTFKVAKLSAFCALSAAENLGFSIARPPGHHAGYDFGGGFCYLNNVAIATSFVLKENERIMIVDWDAHHGNGTQNLFKGREDVFYFSLHQYGIYPGTGSLSESGGNILNIPLPWSCGDLAYHQIFEEILLPIAFFHKPEMILISHGGDSHFKDYMSGLELSSNAYGIFVEKLLKVTKKISVVLEGGYEIESLAN
ncbi:MAG: histone deacetylase family protein, partial [Candidatus Methanofastidiosia archaeon]